MTSREPVAWHHVRPVATPARERPPRQRVLQRGVEPDAPRSDPDPGARPFVVVADLRRAQLPNALQRRSFIAMYENHDRLTRTHFLALGAVGDSIVLQRLITV